MIDNRKLTGDIIQEVRDLIKQDIQIINGIDLKKIPEKTLSFPRMIVDLIDYNDSEYDYVNKHNKYNPETDKIEMEIEKIPKATYRFRIYNNSKNNIDIWNIIADIHRYYSNPYQKKLNGNIQIISTDMIKDVPSGVDYDYVLGYQFTMDFIMSEKFIMSHDYATSLNVKLNINYENKQIDSVELQIDKK